MAWNTKGLTLIEVLVSVVITILVMMYGLSLFISSWRLEVDSESYTRILSHISELIEEYKSKPFYNESKAKTSIDDKFVLHNKVRVLFTFKTQPTTDNSTELIVIAEWPYGLSASEKSKRINTWKTDTIVVKTHLGNNRSYYRYEYDAAGNKLLNVDGTLKKEIDKWKDL